jgi:hypothetical protein
VAGGAQPAGRLTGAQGYRAPPWGWGMDAGEEERLRALPGIAALQALRLPAVRRRLLSVLHARFV